MSVFYVAYPTHIFNNFTKYWGCGNGGVRRCKYTPRFCQSTEAKPFFSKDPVLHTTISPKFSEFPQALCNIVFNIYMHFATQIFNFYNYIVLVKSS